MDTQKYVIGDRNMLCRELTPKQTSKQARYVDLVVNGSKKATGGS